MNLPGRRSVVAGETSGGKSGDAARSAGSTESKASSRRIFMRADDRLWMRNVKGGWIACVCWARKFRPCESGKTHSLLAVKNLRQIARVRIVRECEMLRGFRRAGHSQAICFG